MSEPVSAPDCQADGCVNPARFQYEKAKTCSAGPYSVSEERCEDHRLNTYRQDKYHYRKIKRVFGRYTETVEVETPWWYPWEKEEKRTRWKELEMDPHYFCRKFGKEYCVEGHEKTCPLNYTIEVKR